jgi:hypothetical protein
MVKRKTPEEKAKELADKKQRILEISSMLHNNIRNKDIIETNIKNYRKFLKESKSERSAKAKALLKKISSEYKESADRIERLSKEIESRLNKDLKDITIKT